MIQTMLFKDTLPFGGKTYDVKLDEARLTSQLERVKAVMSDGRYRTLPELKMSMQVRYGKCDSEAALSSRLRDFRKVEFDACRAWRSC